MVLLLRKVIRSSLFKKVSLLILVLAFVGLLSILTARAQIMSSTATLQDTTNNFQNSSNPQRRRRTSYLSDYELASCIKTLEGFAVDGEVNQEQYLLFLESFFPSSSSSSNSEMKFDSFQDLPIELILIFNTAACSSGRDCLNEEPAITLDHVTTSLGLMASLCSSIKDLSVLQIEFSFQYQFKYQSPGNNEIEAESLFDTGINGIDAKSLEGAIENVLLEKLTCGQDNHSSNILHNHRRRRDSRYLRKDTESNSDILMDDEREVTRNLQGHHGTSVCDFIVDAEIVDATNFSKFNPHPSLIKRQFGVRSRFLTYRVLLGLNDTLLYRMFTSFFQ